MKMLLASDFDQTLYFYNRKEQVSSSDLKAISLFQKKGNLFGLSTGRNYTGVHAAIKDLINFDFSILTTGTLILDKNENVLFEKTFDEEIPSSIEKEYSNIDKVFHGRYVAYYFNKGFSTFQKQIYSLKDVVGGVHEISFDLKSEAKAKEFAINLEKEYSNKLIAYPNINYVDVTPYPCSKGNGLNFIKNYYGIKSAAIGDSFNDLPLLENADISFTFSTSPKEIQSKADYVVNSISEAISILLKINK